MTVRDASLQEASEILKQELELKKQVEIEEQSAPFPEKLSKQINASYHLSIQTLEDFPAFNFLLIAIAIFVLSLAIKNFKNNR